MSKEADKELVDSTGTQRSRRRRKKTGLRIPSDNVPRSASVRPVSTADDSEPLAAEGGQTPHPDDSSPGVPPEYGAEHLAKEHLVEHSGSDVSGEYDHSDWTGESSRAPSDGEVVSPIAEDPSVRLRASSAYTPEPPEERLADDGFTTPLPAAAPQVEDEATQFVQADELGIQGPLGDEPESSERLPAAGSAVPPVSEGPGQPATVGGATFGDEDEDLETRKTREMPRVNLEALGLADLLVSDDDDHDQVADADDIPIDEGELEDISGRVQRPSRAPQRAQTVALSDEDLEELMEPLELGDSGVPRRPAGPGMPLRQSRARSAGEFERSDTPDPQASRAKLPDAQGSMPLQVSGGNVAEPDDADAELDTRITEPLPAYDPPEPEAAEPTSQPAPKPVARKPARPPEPGVPAAVAALESGGMESPLDTPLQFGDAGDSGEILADELIEEVDESEVQLDADGELRLAPPPAPAKKPPPSPRKSFRAGEGGKPRRHKKPWFEEIFDEDYLRTLPFLTPQATQAEAVFVASALEVESSSHLLDIGCGYGRHAMELAARGYSVVALDLSLPLLLRGADEAQRRGLSINFVHGDMRELSFESQFDGAYCLFSTFGYFDDETNKKAVQGIARALKPGGRLVVEVLNRDYLITELPTRVWWEGDGCVVLEEVDFNYFNSRIVSNRSVVFDDGRQVEQEISLRSYSLHEFGKLLHTAGFRVLEVSGSMATRGRFFGNQSREIIVVAEKRKSQDGKELDA